MALLRDNLKHKVRSPLLEGKVWEPSNEEVVIIRSRIEKPGWVNKEMTLLNTTPLPAVLIYDDEERHRDNVSNPELDCDHTKALLASGMHVVRISCHCTYQEEFLKTTVDVLHGEKRPALCVSNTYIYEYLVSRLL